MIIIDDKTRDEKLKYNINREAAKISALSSGKIDKYEYLTVKERLPSDQRGVIEQSFFLLQEKHQINKMKQLKIKEKNK